jgi:hypothetical protein
LRHRPNAADLYVHRTPAWLVTTFRATLFVMAAVAGALSMSSWATMPVPARLLVSIVAPALLAFSIWPRPWKGFVKFMADGHGLYFPHNSLLVVSIGGRSSPEWLFVPWRNVENLRVATEAGTDGGSCIAADIKVSDEERAAFFAHVGTPRDRPTDGAEVVFASYDDSPPNPEKTLKLLSGLRVGGGL